MAKKKSEKSEETKSAAAKSNTAKKAAPKRESLSSQTSTPLLDTNLAASNAARSLVAGLKKPAAGGTAPQSKLFQQIKSGQSSASAIGGVLDKGGPQQSKHNQPKHGGNVKGHNQTFGSDASKAFVPRRTGG